MDQKCIGQNHSIHTGLRLYGVIRWIGQKREHEKRENFLNEMKRIETTFSWSHTRT